MAEGSDPIYDEDKTIIGWKRNIYSYPPIGSPDGGAYVTAGDLDRFLRAVQRGQLLSPELTAAFFTPQAHWQTSDQWKTYFGYGLEFYVDPAGQMVCYEKEGSNAGVSGVIRHFPKEDINLVILSNLEDGAWKPLWDHSRNDHGWQVWNSKRMSILKMAGSTFVLCSHPTLLNGCGCGLRSGPTIRQRKLPRSLHFLSTTPHSKLPMMHEAFVCERPDGTLCGLVEVSIRTSCTRL